jgi:hypothetical protein
VYTFPEGRYELRGTGSPASPHYWVWIPESSAGFAPGPATTSPAELQRTSGQVDHVDGLNRSLKLRDGKEFEFPDGAAMTNMPKVGQQVVVTYYVTEDGRNIAHSIDHNSVR